MPEPSAPNSRNLPSPTAMPRRAFIALSGLAIAAGALDSLPVMAGPYEPSDFDKLIPPDKKLHPDWVKSLFARGNPTVYSKKRNELRYIGMPVGGLCCGTVYLGGDGRLWLWDIFNQNKLGILGRNVEYDGFGEKRSLGPIDGSAYVAPHEEQSPFSQGFAIKVNGVTRPLDITGWQDITFRGEYPLGVITYADPACPVRVELTAYSPFIPLNFADSALPATICEFAVTNLSTKSVTVELAGWLQNACSLYTAKSGTGSRMNTVHTDKHATLVLSEFDLTPTETTAPRPDVLVDDFERDTWGDWRTEGTAFGAGPIKRSDIPGYQGDVGGIGSHVVNSHASAPGKTVEEKDGATGKLTSPAFTIQRKYISFFVGGGANADQVGIRLLVDGAVVCRAAGSNNNAMHRDAFDVAQYEGKQGVIEIYDQSATGWGNIGVSHIVQTDSAETAKPTAKDRDYGTMAIACLGAGIGKAEIAQADAFSALATAHSKKPVGQKVIGAVCKQATIAPGKSRTVTFAVAWHFANSGLNVPGAETGAHYARRFTDARQVAAYVAQNYARLSADTKLWHATWNDSSLPHWFLNRTFANTSILATTTAHRFANGRFWGWEGIGCCEGTCSHVWHYAQAMGRIFPEVERDHRERIDFGAAFDKGAGVVQYRGEGTGPAVDGQCGRILGVLREHQMSPDPSFLKRVWPNVKLAIQYLMRHDSNGDGLLDGPQENTLDAAWYGEIAWISSLYAAALRAGEQMATVVGDSEFAIQCHTRFLQTRQAIDSQLFNGEFFIQRPEKGREAALGTYQTCHIDQVHGQSWAWQVGLGRVLDHDKTISALKALYKYNFATDLGPFRRKNRAGRAYAVAGDGGLVMSTNPKQIEHAFGNTADWQFGYFNECMSGFEHQAASHMIAEGLVQEGLAVTRAIHDRYHAAKRNPYNEIECSDHYSRAMASYGSYITACGYEYDGPAAHIGFAPRVNPNAFRAAFTAAQGWGTFEQKRARGALTATITLRHGALAVKTISLVGTTAKARVTVQGEAVACSAQVVDGKVVITLGRAVSLKAGQKLQVVLG